MKQFLRSFLTLLMLVVWASGFAAEKTYSYTFKSGGTFTAKNQTKTFNGVEWTISTDAGYFAFNYGANQIGSKKKPGKNTTISTSDFSGTIKSVKVNGWNSGDADAKVEVLVGQTSYGSQSFTTTTNDYIFAGSSTGNVLIKIANNAGAFYIKTISVTYEEGPTKTPTTLTFPKTAISINGGDEASFKGQSAQLYAGKQELTDKTIEYAHTGNEIFATFDKTTGAATLKSGVYGTATVTATYAGDDTYAKAEASYTVKIVDPNASEVTFDFSKPGDYDFEVPTNGNGVNIEGKSIVSGIVSLTVKHDGDTKSRFWNTNGVITYRLYDGTINTVSVPEGYVITAIAVTAADKKKLITIGENTDNSDWTGSAQAVDITGTGKAVLTSMTVTYSKVATTTSLPLDETTTAEDAKTLLGANLNKTVNVTINRTLVANKWNTLCLPFDVTAEQIKNILKAEGMVREYKDQTADCINFQAAETMTAGVPYLIKPTEEVKGLTFEGVKITATEGVAKGAEAGSTDESLSICGVLGAKALSTDGSELFLNAAGKFVAPAEGKQTMRGFRAYFMSMLGAGAKINIDGETTGINSIETEATVNGKVYNLNGQYVGNSLNGLKKGIYVVNGKKVIK